MPRQPSLIGYLPAGYPTLEGSKRMLAAMQEGVDGQGCDVVEVGVPFSDPVLEGPTIRAATEQALRAGIRTRDVFEVVSSVAESGGHAVVMTYWNPVQTYGTNAFARDAQAAGASGVIIPDLVLEEADEWVSAATEHRLDRIFLVAPSTPNWRIPGIVAATSGWVYAAVTSTTGSRDQVSSAAPELVRRVQAHTDLPVCAGFGVSCAAHAATLAAVGADGVVCGSAFVERVRHGEQALRLFAAELAAGVRRGASARAPVR